ncbi:unnamed protein product, partial [Didymodactylos carnosus]
TPSNGLVNDSTTPLENGTHSINKTVNDILNTMNKKINGTKRQLNGYILTQLAIHGDEYAQMAFQLFGQYLGDFLRIYVDKFQPNMIIIGGGLALASYLFEDKLIEALGNVNVEIKFCLSHEFSSCIGSVYHWIKNYKEQEIPKNPRQTAQYLLPVVKTNDETTMTYDIYPTHLIPDGEIYVGYKTLCDKIFELLDQSQMILIDGYVGTFFDEFATAINEYSIQRKSQMILFYDTKTFLLNDDKKRQYYLGDNKSIFGRLCTDKFEDFIDDDNFQYLKQSLSYPCIVIGPGASLIDKESPLIYIDLPKNELYYRVQAQRATSYLKPLEINNNNNNNNNQLSTNDD